MSPRPKTKDWLGRYSDRAWLAAAVVIGAVVRFINISKSSIWHDEGYTMMLAPQSPAQIWLRTGRDVHPPLYYWTLHYWMLLFGTSEAAVRSLSLAFMLGVIVIMFALVRRLFGNRAARLTALFLALGPFVVRYSQEARMYGMLAFVAALATYLLVRALESNRWTDWLLYGVSVALGLYTYYYVIFMIVFHWAYMGFRWLYPKPSWSALKSSLLSPKWIAANALAIIIWLPWMPTAYVQLTKIQSPPWIPKATLNTLPASFGQFLTFTDIGGHIGNLPLAPVRNMLFALFGVSLLGFLVQQRSKARPVMLMILYAGLTPVLVWLLSFGAHPKYVDRYFVFAAVAFYALLAIIFTESWPWRTKRWLANISIVVTLAVLIVGIGDVYRQANHTMRQLAQGVESQYQPGDALVAGDFYTFFDFRYYATVQAKLPSTVQAYVPNDFPGCCEGRSLLYDQPQLVLKNWSDVHPTTGYAWIIGHIGDSVIRTDLPTNWHPAGDEVVRGDLAAQRYQVQ